jgi:hypothetical protein
LLRISAATLALVLTGAPVVTDICEATCAARDAQAPVSHHSCHQQSESNGPAIGAIHVCGHEDGIPTALERVHHVIVAPAVASAVALPAPAEKTFHLRAAIFDSSPPAHLNLISQLRV